MNQRIHLAGMSLDSTRSSRRRARLLAEEADRRAERGER